MTTMQEKFEKADATVLAMLNMLAATPAQTVPQIKDAMKLAAFQVQEHLLRCERAGLVTVARGKMGARNHYSAAPDYKARFPDFQAARNSRWRFKKMGPASARDSRARDVEAMLALARAARPDVRTTWRMPVGAAA